MSIIDITTLKSRFQDGDIPSGVDFGNLIDTLENPSSIPVSYIEATGPRTSATFLRGDGTWSDVQSGSGSQGPQGAVGAQGQNGFQGTAGVQGPQGLRGPQGEIGLTGPQGGAGDQGIQGASITGPQGPQGASVTGPQGSDGAGFTNKGNWSSSTQYTVNDVVQYSGSSYYAISDNINVIPPTDNLQIKYGYTQAPSWAILAAHGAQGADGVQGANGVVGPQGANGVVGTDGAQGPQGDSGSTNVIVYNMSADHVLTAGHDGNSVLAFSSAATITLPTDSGELADFTDGWQCVIWNMCPEVGDITLSGAFNGNGTKISKGNAASIIFVGGVCYIAGGLS